MADSKSKVSLFSFANIFSIIGASTGIIALIVTVSHNRQLTAIAYRQDASSYRPSLEIVKPLDSLYFDMKLDSINPPSEGGHTITMNLTSGVSGKIAFVNLGNTIAHEIAFAVGDTFDDHAIIRKLFRSKEGRLELSKKLNIDKSIFLKKLRIPPLDTIYEDFKRSFYNVQDDSMVILHVFLLYTNEGGALYDTYYWLRIHTRSRTLPVKSVSIDGEPALMMKFLKSDLVGLIQDNVDSYIYKIDERNEILDWIEKEAKFKE